jgi:hypothetical protein
MDKSVSNATILAHAITNVNDAAGGTHGFSKVRGELSHLPSRSALTGFNSVTEVQVTTSPFAVLRVFKLRGLRRHVFTDLDCFSEFKLPPNFTTVITD